MPRLRCRGQSSVYPPKSIKNGKLNSPTKGVTLVDFVVKYGIILIRPKAGDSTPSVESPVPFSEVKELDAKGRKPSLLSGRKPSPKNLYRRGGTRRDAKRLWRIGKALALKARLVEADIRLGCPFGHTRKSVKRIPSLQVWEQSKFMRRVK